jgi:hypothetical protein
MFNFTLASGIPGSFSCTLKFVEPGQPLKLSSRIVWLMVLDETV